MKGLWSARVGNYRILCTIDQSHIVIRAIRHRAIAYGQSL
jgi:mRNA-degrading endonuclease RelE of RelBE toxin-antitoxin system